MPSDTPEIVVGIDFGMTCTGVAYSLAPDWPYPHTIQHWPGKLGLENRNKVDTIVAYDRQTGNPVTWGFLVNKQSRHLEVQNLFKLFLDPTYREDFRVAPSLDEARKWYTDYLRYIYQTIRAHFDDHYPRWSSKIIEFVFSVPTTWKDPAMIAETERLIKSAGFSERPNQKVRITLTEAEAAAVYASRQAYQKGDVLLVCDAGGGTTDVNLLKVTSSSQGRTQLEPLSWVEGRAIGSTLIDFKAGKMILSRLEAVRYHLPEDPSLLAEKMMQSDRFETYKCSFGVDAQNKLDLLIPIPNLAGGLDLDPTCIRDSKLIVKQDELREIFDLQIDKMFKLIDEQLSLLERDHPRENVSYLVMSGGLGSSPYVKQRLKRRYEIPSGHTNNARDMRVLLAREPQLAVCHGIVLDRTQEIKGAGPIYTERCCRHSYGVLVRELYNPIRHMGEDVVLDPRDKQKWAERQVHWFIKQGQKISVGDGIRHHFCLKINLGQENKAWKTQLVRSTNPSSQLPQSMRQGGLKTICTVESRLNPADLKLKNRHWYQFRPQYWRAEFDVKVMIGAADLKFQIWGKDGCMSKDHDEIEVQWDPPPVSGAGVGTTSEDNWGMFIK